jgi:mono/diheme cytochrome c family protein
MCAACLEHEKGKVLMYHRLTLLILLTGLLLVGCISPQPLPNEPTPIPTLIPATMPAESAPAQAASTGTDPGSGIFDANCSVCHNLNAEAKVGPGLAGLFEKSELPNGNPVNEENLKEWIRTGGGAMPGLPLSDSELDALVAFLEDAIK